MTTQPNNEATYRKPKPLITIVIAGAFLAAVILWVLSYWLRESVLPPASPQITNQAKDLPQSGRKWFSDFKNSPSISDGSKKFRDIAGYFNLNGLTVSQFVKTQYAAANKGDKDAAFNIYRAESICSRSTDAQRTLNLLPIETEKLILDSTKSYIKDAQPVCADLNISPKERLDYLRIAAKAGLAEAAIGFAIENPEGLNFSPEIQIDYSDPNVIQWQKDVVDYLTQPATQGNTKALGWLATMYEGGRLIPRNLQMALTYNLARAQILNENPNDNPVTASMLQNLPPDQVNAAEAAATALVNACCKQN
ncbi:hypothetical protein [Solimicrobium silvestre]|uniref:Sel1 repeat n=1 Tax=Solimicrobium silvestre TaxID=2099400 RepID=A0A2S9GYW8_9BURK|nr:hypothetical protein [Solimicrobium silvestre]PRC92922.1 hypothetical protein S2091_2339 [Solimicrobium silvestre]